MELYNFVRGVMAWTVTIAGLPWGIPLVALAYKIQNGPKPITMPPREFWTRSTFAWLCVAVASWVMVFVDYLLATWAQLPEGPIHIIVFMGYVPVAVWILFVFFAFDDLLTAVGLFVLYLYLPVFVLFVLNR